MLAAAFSLGLLLTWQPNFSSACTTILPALTLALWEDGRPTPVQRARTREREREREREKREGKTKKDRECARARIVGCTTVAVESNPTQSGRFGSVVPTLATKMSFVCFPLSAATAVTTNSLASPTLANVSHRKPVPEHTLLGMGELAYSRVDKYASHTLGSSL